MTALRLAVDRLPESAVRDDVVGDLGALEDAIGELIRDARTPRVVENEMSDVGAVAGDRATFWTILATEQKREFTVSIEEGLRWSRHPTEKWALPSMCSSTMCLRTLSRGLTFV